jgi:hypothetical protein
MLVRRGPVLIVGSLEIRKSAQTTCPVTRLHVQVTAAKRGEDNFRIADNRQDPSSQVH